MLMLEAESELGAPPPKRQGSSLARRGPLTAPLKFIDNFLAPITTTQKSPNVPQRSLQHLEISHESEIYLQDSRF